MFDRSRVSPIAIGVVCLALGCAEGQTDDGTCGGDADCLHLNDGCRVGVCDAEQHTCYAQPHAGAVCDDDDPCTTDDTCDRDGRCVGAAYECSSSAVCVDAECDGLGGCVETVQPGFCAIGNTSVDCYADGVDKADDPCRWCDATANAEDWTTKPPGASCGSSTDPCLRQSACNESGVCVDQGYPPAGTPCGSTPAECEGQDTCDGAGHCIDQGLAPAGTVCRASTGPCDPQEQCSGTSADCPSDQTLPAGGDCGVCRACDAAGQCVVNSTDHTDCSDCQKCSAGSCVPQSAGEDLQDLCPDLVCTNLLYGANGADCHAYASSTAQNGFCDGTGFCAGATDACTGQGAVVQTCADAACIRCPAGGTASQACYNDLLRHGCASGYVCSGGDCIVDPGSCPFLYTWNGNEFGFETDIYGSGKLGVRLASGYWKPTPDDYYRLRHEPVPTGGSFEVRLVEERSEVNYFDFATMVAVDVPQGLDVYTELHGLGTPYVPLADSLHTVAEVLQPPVWATHVNRGGSVLTELSQVDGVYAVLSNDRNLDFDYNTIELDLGDLSSAPQIKLVIDGTTVFPNSPAGIARKALFGSPTRVEVLDENLQWVEVPKPVFYMPPPKEARRPFVMDVTNVFMTDVCRIRLTWLFKTYLDFIGLDTTADVQPTLQALPLESADLRHYGHSQRVGDEVFEFVYGSVSQDLWPAFPGDYTRFGDVFALLQSVDDKFVIFWAGDEVALRFTPPTPPPAGSRRRYVLHTHGYYKDLTFGGPHEVELLPFGAMSNYPYDPADEHYPDDPDHTTYLQTYNTRTLP
ncbi:MAG: hypothetical protein JRI23_08805 [Deltaproteobacteria bacterium]|jgi:hypothetical protein|nr:hypothetical protein [Deltaproteobacteria bacterium]MBW2531730.1 hypothetical protein [Deltaproteobacteria bacterium]